MVSMGEVVAQIRAAIAMIDQAAAEVRGAVDRISGPLGELRYALEDSANSLAAEGLAQWTAAREKLEEALAALASGSQRWNDYLASIGEGGGSVASPTVAGGGVGVPHAPSPPPLSGAGPSPFNPRRFDASKLAGLRRYSEAGTAEGKLYLSDGSPHSGKVLRARPPGSSAFPPERVKEEYRDTTPNRGHIEGDAAAVMHRDDLREVTLYLNAEPCDNRGQGCKENTHAFVPEDGVINIWAVNDDGSRVFKRVNGTGEAFNG